MLMRRKKGGNRIEFVGCTIFRDDKAVGILTPTQTKYLQLLRGVSVAPASFTLPQSGTTLVLLSSHAKLIATEAEIGADFRLILEIDETRHPEVSDEELKRIQQELNQYLEQDIKRMISQLQQLHSDPVGFGEKYRVSRSGSLDAAKWLAQDYPQRAVTIRVNSFIKRTGMIR
jgi:spore germination protein